MVSFTRRAFLASSAASLGALAGCSQGGSFTGNGGDTGGDTSPTGTPGPLSSLELAVEPVAAGFTAPVSVLAPSPAEYYVADQRGVVSRVTPNADPTPVLDLRDRIVEVSGYDERGLLGLALDLADDGTGRLYVRYSAPRREGTPRDYSHTFVLSSFPISDGTVERSAERTLLEIPQPQSNHNAGAIDFGPDGYLYVAVGDGGGGGDQGRGHVDDWYDAVDGGNGQDVTENLLGSILRIDVDQSSGDRPYAIPDDNPLVGSQGLDEHFAWGFRNPWRFSFGPGGRLFVADVGQNEFEEVSVVERGGNYGWNVREGTHCFSADECPSETPDGHPLRSPIVEYPHDGASVAGISVIGGYLYRGDAIPALGGRYVFADWRADGRLFVATESDSGRWPTTSVPVADEDFGSNVLSFGETPAGELLVCTVDQTGVSGSSGAVHRLTLA